MAPTAAPVSLAAGLELWVRSERSRHAHAAQRKRWDCFTRFLDDSRIRQAFTSYSNPKATPTPSGSSGH